MLLYSKKIIRFVQQIKIEIREILVRDLQLKVHGDRFTHRQFSYPINVVMYNNKTLLGYFNPDFFELGFHLRLMHIPKEQLRQIIKHELAHFMTFILHGPAIQAHGMEFRAFCLKMGWGEDVFRATTCLDDGIQETENDESHVLRKVKKLMALSSSSNEHEAEQALIKSQQLVLKHHIDETEVDSTEEEQVVLKRILKQKRENAKMRSITIVLETFFVIPVYRKGNGFICVEMIGSPLNIEIAEYVASFLDVELDRQWEKASKRTGLKGMVAKNSFFLGIAKGYCNKINTLKKEHHSSSANAILVIGKMLNEAKAMVYPRLSSTKSSGRHCSESSALGEQVGRHLSINPGLHSDAKQSGASLIYSPLVS